jgi:hypothetical protein
MSNDFEWTRMLFAMGLLTAMFPYPVLSLWRDGRKQRGEPACNIDRCSPAEEEPCLCAEPSTRQTEAGMQPDACAAPGSPSALTAQSEAWRNPQRLRT